MSPAIIILFSVLWAVYFMSTDKAWQESAGLTKIVTMAGLFALAVFFSF